MNCDKTQHGVPCQRWDARWPHVPKYKRSDSHHNYCSYLLGFSQPWCYTNDPNGPKWDFCDPECITEETSKPISATTAITSSTHQSNRQRCETFDIKLYTAAPGSNVIKVLSRSDGLRNIHSCQEKIYIKNFYEFLFFSD